MTNTAASLPLYHVIMSTHGKVAHLENEQTGRPMCGVRIETGRRLGLLAAGDVTNACRICIETERFLHA